MSFVLSRELSKAQAEGVAWRNDAARRGAAMRLMVFVFLLVAQFLATQLRAEPAEHWLSADPSSGEWTAENQAALEEYGRANNPTAVMIVRAGHVLAQYGDVAAKVNLRSVRKSILGALYGIAVSDGRMKLSATVGDLGIEDTPPGLSIAEKQATIRDLLMARSGIYHPAAYETHDMGEKRPARGSHAPGSYWYCNNWDFNALGTIYRQATAEDIFKAFERRIAKPTGMEDFSVRDGEYVSEPASRHPAYVFRLTARDAARFGLLFLNGGEWRGRRIVPAVWIAESTAALSQTDWHGRGYGYLWWTLPPGEWGPGAFLASGHGGQLIVVVPSRQLVAVQTVEIGGQQKGIRTTAFLDFVQRHAP